jgi:hypothetical protein
LIVLFKRILAFLISPLLSEYGVFNIYERTLEELNEADYLPKIQNATHKIIETIEQLDELLNEAFDLSLLDVNQARYRLGKGATLALIFIDRELGYRGWGAFTKKAKKTFDRYPYKVDFTNNEVVGGGAWTNPKYRRQGFHTYSAYKWNQFCIEKGVTKERSIILSTNTASQGTATKIGNKLVAKTRYVRILGLEFWRERPVQSTNEEG